VEVVAETTLDCLILDSKMIFSLETFSNETHVLGAWDSDDVSALLDKRIRYETIVRESGLPTARIPPFARMVARLP
jgi:hypothetical protein